MANSYPQVFDLSTLDGSNGFAIDGIEAGDNIAITLSEAGDVNNDGVADLLVGAPFQDILGGAYLIFGSADGFSSSLNLRELTGENGLFLKGKAANFVTFFPIIVTPTQSLAGIGIDGIGDFNNDGIDDIAVGSPGGNIGEITIVFGADQFPAELDLDDDLIGPNGFDVEEGDGDSRLFGSSVSGIGDVNGDGIDDVILGAPGTDRETGEAYVIFGTTEPLPADTNTDPLDGTNGFGIVGEAIGQEFGRSVAGLGDFNGDGINDLAIGAPSSDNALPTRSYVIFGSANGYPAQLAVTDLDGTNGFAIAGASTADEFGHILSSAGDLNGDGLNDLMVGAPLADANGEDSGQAYVIFGSDDGFPAQLDVANLDGTNGFVIDGLAAGDRLGDIVSQAGDLNDDGIADILLGAPESDVNGENSGQAYAIFGSQTPFPANFDLNTLDGSSGFIVNGQNAGDELGESVSGIGDFNGDGIDDIALGAPNATTNGNAESGQAYIIFGRGSTQTVEVEVGEAIAIALPQPVVPDALNLYDGAEAGVTLPDLILTDATQTSLEGSLAIDEAGTTIQFVPTGNALDPGTYTLTLPDAADGFASNATPLDGDGDGTAGGAFQFEFTVEESGSDHAISIPDFARAPGQTVQFYDRELEATTPGLPVTIDDGAQVTEASFTLTYNPELLQVSGVIDDSLPEGWVVQSEAIDPVLGTLDVTLAGTALAAGQTDLMHLDVSVPETATYRETGVLTIASVNLNDGVIAASGDAAIQHVSLLGDANGDREYSLDDALAIAQNAIDLGTGFAAHARIAPAIVADVTGDGTISALDASVVAAQAAGLTPPELLI